MNVVGRPSEYDPAIAELLCQRLGEGQALYRICGTEGIPSAPTIYRWMDQNDTFRKDYIRARETQAERFADEILTIVDEEEDPQRARVRMDARKWAAAKLAPRRYGDRVAAELSGPDGGPIQTESPDAAKLAQALLAALNKGTE